MAKSHGKSFHIIYFFLQPFFTLLYYLKNFRKPEAKNVMWLFTIFYGFTFAIGVENQNSDINSYVNDIPLLHNLNLTFSGFLVYHKATGEVDILRNSLAYVVSYFTANGYYLIIIYGIIYGYFFSRNMWYVLDRLEGKTKMFTKVLIFGLFLSIPIWGLNGFRFWTAAHVFIFILLPYLFEGKKKRLVWCLIIPFVIHYSFLIALFPLLIYLIFGNKVKLYYIFFIITLFISAINLSQFNNLIETYAPQSFADRSASYRLETKVKTLRTEGQFGADQVWYVKYAGFGIRYSLAAFLLAFYWTFRKSIHSNKELLKLLSFTLLFYGFANILSSIPSGYRFLKVADVLTLSFLILHLQNNKINRDLYYLANITTPLFLLFIIVGLRASWYSLSVMTIIGNPITAIFTFGENISLNDIIKGL
ncbi:hypothetical protein EI546_05965 [Aequorivita sp. H23M31]|uniref:EpsG family protein n=2 Tax=Aequorivita ciconiae TaxID=2494375 RepID=A0A410G225_9FLAO|nr:EpsG family protein [Aequorivita sp. H23M31]QAA81301.1 hypothetical protein EI546_05965 [Aequorivita sp. H23M31]